METSVVNVEQHEAIEPPKKKRGNPAFVKGHIPHNKKGVQDESGEANGCPFDPESVKDRLLVLEAMRAVLGQAAKFDKTEYMKGCRKWYKADPKGYLQTLLRYEHTLKGGKEGSKGGGEDAPDKRVEEVDVGEERAREVILRLITAAKGGKE